MFDKTQVKWQEITEEKFDYYLGVLPPVDFRGYRFLVGEACDHRQCRATMFVRSTYQACYRSDGKFYASCEPLTRPEFEQIIHSDLINNLVPANEG